LIQTAVKSLLLKRQDESEKQVPTTGGTWPFSFEHTPTKDHVSNPPTPTNENEGVRSYLAPLLFQMVATWLQLKSVARKV